MKFQPIAAASVVLFLCLSVFAQTNFDLSGRWQLRVDMSGIEVCHGSMVLKQSEHKISGTYKELSKQSKHVGQTGKLEGTIQGTNVSITLTFSDNHSSVWVGAAAANKMTGTLTAQGMGNTSWSWVATRDRKDE